MLTEYREIYQRLSEKLYLADDLLREEGLDVSFKDSISASTAALLILYARRIKALEERVGELQGDVARFRRLMESE